MKTRITVQLTEELVVKLKAHTESHLSTVSAVVRRALENYLKESL